MGKAFQIKIESEIRKVFEGWLQTTYVYDVKLYTE